MELPSPAIEWFKFIESAHLEDVEHGKYMGTIHVETPVVPAVATDHTASVLIHTDNHLHSLTLTHTILLHTKYSDSILFTDLKQLVVLGIILVFGLCLFVDD
jgi:hypothetical protein